MIITGASLAPAPVPAAGASGLDRWDSLGQVEPAVPALAVVDVGCVWPGIRDRWAVGLARAVTGADLELSFAEACEWIHDAPRDRLIQTLARKTRLEPQILQPLVSAIWGDFENLALADAHLPGGTGVAPGAPEALAALQSEGCRIFIHGPVARALLETRVEQLDWRRTGLVDGCLGTEDGAASGTPPGWRAGERLGRHPVHGVARVVASTAAAERAGADGLARVICLGCPPPRRSGPPAQFVANLGEMLAALLAYELR